METSPHAENLALWPGTRLLVSDIQPTGGGARDPRVLLNESALHLDGKPLADFEQHHTYNTYDGQNHSRGLDWYVLEFPTPATFNCVEMTMGIPYRDGGWWTSLAVEACTESGTWRPVNTLTMTPEYNFTDARGHRRPYETYTLFFETVTCRALRLSGQPGGMAQFTSLARLAVYQRDFLRWNPSMLPRPPMPYIFQLIAPETIWDLSENMAKLTGLAVGFPLLENYIDERRYQCYWQRIRRNYEGAPDLWFLVGEVIGWNAWRQIGVTIAGDPPPPASMPHVRLSFYGTLASAIAPVIIEGQVLGEMTTRSAIVADVFSPEWHRNYASQHAIPWDAYQSAIARSPQLRLEQLEGAAALMGMIANTIANLVYDNLHLQRRLDGVQSSLQQRAQERRALMHKAIDLMHERLEDAIDIAEIARELALSPSYFCTLFTEQMGRNPSDYLIDLRLERAKQYLTQTSMSVLEICAALGYNPSYFSRLFKQRTGITPSQYAQPTSTR